MKNQNGNGAFPAPPDGFVLENNNVPEPPKGFQLVDDYERRQGVQVDPTTPDPGAGGLGQAIIEGTKQTGRALGTAFDVVTGDEAEIREDAAVRQDQTGAQRRFHEALQSRQDQYGDESVLQGLKNVVGAVAEEPMGAFHEMGAQLPNSAVVIGGMAGGAKAGAMAGTAIAPGAGTAVGAIVGGIAGMFLGNSAIETGFIAQQQAREGELDTSKALQQGATKGGVITAIDAATLGFNKFLLGAPGKAASKAATKAVDGILKKAGVDTASDAAVATALRLDPALQRAVREGGQAAFVNALPSKMQKAARGALAMTTETLSEGTGEYLGSQAAGLDASFTEAVMEGLLSLPQSAAEAGISGAMSRRGNQPQFDINVEQDPNAPWAGYDVQEVDAMPFPGQQGIDVADLSPEEVAGAAPPSAAAEPYPGASGIGVEEVPAEDMGDITLQSPSPLQEMADRLRQRVRDMQTDQAFAEAERARAAQRGSELDQLARAAMQERETPSLQGLAGRVRQRLPDMLGEAARRQREREEAQAPEALTTEGIQVEEAFPAPANTAMADALRRAGAAPDGQSGQAVAADPEEIRPKSGQPYASEASARNVLKIRKDIQGKGYQPVEVEGGWVLRLGPAPTTAPPAGVDIETPQPAEGGIDAAAAAEGAGDQVTTPATGAADTTPQETVSEPATAAGPATEAEKRAKEMRNFDDFKSWARGRYGRAEYQRKLDSGELHNTWNKVKGGENAETVRGDTGQVPGERRQDEGMQDQGGQGGEQPAPEGGQAADEDAPEEGAAVAFAPTHELPDGTMVRAIEDQDGVYVDADGQEYEEPNATEVTDAQQVQAAETPAAAPAAEEGGVEKPATPTKVSRMLKDLDYQGAHKAAKESGNPLRYGTSKPKKGDGDFPMPYSQTEDVKDLPFGVSAFVGKDIYGNWTVVETTTGMSINVADDGNTKNAAVESARKRLLDKGLAKTREAIDRAQKATQDELEKRFLKAVGEKAGEQSASQRSAIADVHSASQGYAGRDGKYVNPDRQAIEQAIGRAKKAGVKIESETSPTSGTTTHTLTDTESGKRYLLHVAQGGHTTWKQLATKAPDEFEPLPVPRYWENQTAPNKKLYQLDDFIEGAQKPMPFEVENLTPDSLGNVTTLEMTIHQLLSWKNASERMHGALITKRGKSVSPKEALQAWMNYNQLALTLNNWASNNPDAWAAYQERQRVVRELGVGDRVRVARRSSEFPLGFPAEITKKNKVNWSLKDASGMTWAKGRTYLQDPATLRPIDADEKTIDEAANEAATSPTNDLPEPTEGQKEAGNYKVGKISIHGLEISIENPKGSKRTGTDKDGETWSQTMRHHYGYIRGTVGKDKDHIDIFIGPEAQREQPLVFVVDQINPETKEFDEHKIMFGFLNIPAARQGYLSNYPKGWNGVGAVTQMTLEDFKSWVFDQKNTKQAASPVIRQKPVAQETVKIEKPWSLDKIRKFLLDGGVMVGPIRVDIDTGGLAGRYRALITSPKFNQVISDSNGYSDMEPLGDFLDLRVVTQVRDIWEKEYSEAQKGYSGNDRRKDAARRKRVENMTEAEMRRELLTDNLTGLGNRRAYDEDLDQQPDSIHAYMDVDALKWVNDNMGHGNGDELLKAMGAALKEAMSLQEAIDGPTATAYHLSGDEFVVLAATQDQARKIAERAQAIGKSAEFEYTAPDGTTITKNGVEFSYGIGQDLKTADEALQRNKAEREAAGLRPARGAVPAGVVTQPAEGGQAEVQGTAEPIAVKQPGKHLAVSKRFTGILEKELQAAGVDSTHDDITIHFRDPKYSAKTGGYHPVEVAIQPDGTLRYITDYTYAGPDNELVKEIDFDFESKVFGHNPGFGDPRDRPLVTGRGLYKIWQSNFSNYYDMGVFEVEVRSDKLREQGGGRPAGIGEIPGTTVAVEQTLEERLLVARNQLIAFRSQAEAQGRVVDDRLLDRIRRQEQLVKDLEREVRSATPEASLGKNADGEDVFEDANGVRYVKMGSIRIYQKVTMRQTRAGIQKEPVPDRRFEIVTTIEPRVPQGFKLVNYGTSVPEGAGYNPGGIHTGEATAVVQRDNPYKVERGFGKTVQEAIDSAVARLQPAEPVTNGERSKNYGKSNTVFTEDAAAKARELLKKKLGQLNAGIDPEVLQAGLTLAGYHIEAGARAFADYTKAMIADLGEGARPYLRSWYESVRHYPGFDKDGMTDPADIEKEAAKADRERSIVSRVDIGNGVEIHVVTNDKGHGVVLFDRDSGEYLPEVKSFRGEDSLMKALAYADSIERKGADRPSSYVETLAGDLYEGRRFASITEARKRLAELTGGSVAESGTVEAKRADETIEQAGVLAARRIVEDGGDEAAVFDRLQDLSDRMPSLNVRTSTSVAQQAYSTPFPLAYVASRLARIDRSVSVLEPTAGNGALLIEASPQNTMANELNADRRKFLSDQGFEPYGEDAASFDFGVPDADVVIANPPFGAVKDGDGNNKKFPITEQYSTSEIDHAIALNALKAMKDDGRAVLIIGGPNKILSDESRSDAYNGKAKRTFFYTLYNQYRVTDHFTVSGDLYAKQGAAWPVDVLVIEGRGKSSRALPAADLPRKIDSTEDLRNVLTNRGDRETGAGAPAGRGQPASDNGRTGEPPLDSRDSRRDADGDAAGILAGLDGQPEFERGPAGTADSGPGDVRVGRGSDPEPDSVENVYQAPYSPKSAARPVGTLLPVNLREPVSRSLENIADRHGSVDQFVADELGYPVAEIPSYFSAEQVDALALALDNMKRDKGFIIGDQTGVGKGRVVAGMIRWAKRQGKMPIFVTEKPKLYGDMMRDLEDIGMPDAEPFITNAGESIPLDDTALDWFEDAEAAKSQGKRPPRKRGRFLSSSGAQKHGRTMTEMMSGDHPAPEMIFTTYSQMQTVKGARTDRMNFIENFARDGVIIFDESHNAGGTTTSSPFGEKDEFGKTGRAAFARDIARAASSVFYSSATYAKRPDVMDLYFKTDMGDGMSGSELANAIKAGGVPLQQVVATMLADAGQYIRREKSFDGILYETVSTDTDKQFAENAATIMRGIMRFDKMKLAAIKAMDKELKAQAKQMSGDGSTGGAGAMSTNFTSVMHNLLGQMLLTLTVDAAADRAIAALQKGEKPVIAVSNTMGSAIEEYAEQVDLKPGDPIALSFGDLMKRYLEKSRRIIEGDPFGRKTSRQLSDAELGESVVNFYNGLMERIDDMGFDRVPISPIDAIHQKLRSAGYKTGEITGRGSIIDYSAQYSGKPEPEVAMSATETEQDAGRVKADLDEDFQLIAPGEKFQFADGSESLKTDTVWAIISPGGFVVGYGTTPSGAFEQYRRWRKNPDSWKSIVIRPEEYEKQRRSNIGAPIYRRRPSSEQSTAGKTKTINDFNSGNIDAIILNQSGATGLSLHASERFTDQSPRVMILAQAELNVDTHMQMLGRINRTGQVVLPRYEQLVPDIAASKRPASILAKKMASLNANTTGARDSALKAKDTPDFMNEYGDQVAAQIMTDNPEWHDAIGQPLKNAKVGDGLEPEGAMRKVSGRIPVLSLANQQTVYEAIEEAYIDLLDTMRRAGQNTLEAETLELDAVIKETREVRAPANDSGSPFAAPVVAEIMDVKRLGKPLTLEQVDDLIRKELGINGDEDIERARLIWSREQAQQIRDEADMYRQKIEDSYDETQEKQRDAVLARIDYQKEKVLDTILSGLDQPVTLIGPQGEHYQGIVGKIERSGSSANPVAPGQWRVTVYVADAARQFRIPLSKIDTSTDGGKFALVPAGRDKVEEAFTDVHSRTRETRTVMTGNLLAAFGTFNTGRVVNFKMRDGTLRQGIIMPRTFNLDEAEANLAVPFDDKLAAARFLRELTGIRFLHSPDKAVRIGNHDNGFILRVPASKAAGARYFLNENLMRAAGGEFVKSGADMRVMFPDASLAQVLDVLYEIGVKLQATTRKEEAEQFAGQHTRFSRSAAPEAPAPLGLDLVKATADRIVGAGGLSGGVRVHTVATEQDLPLDIIEQAKKEGALGQVVAVHRGRDIYVVADRHTSVAQVEESILHEGSHYGAKQLFGGEQQKAYRKLWFALGGVKGIRELGSKLGFQMESYIDTAADLLQKGDMTSDQRATYLIDEFLAHAQGQKAYESLPAKFSRAIKEFWGSIKAMLRAGGFAELQNYTESDLAYLLRNIHKAARGRQVSITGMRQAMFMRTGQAMGQARIAADNGEQAMFSRTITENAQAIREASIPTWKDKGAALWDSMKEAAAGPLGNLPNVNKYLKSRYLTLGRIAEIDEGAREIYEAFAEAGDDIPAVYEFLTSREVSEKVIKNRAVRDKAVDVKRRLEEIGEGLVERGLLSAEAFENNRGQYLPRIYLKHLLKDADIALIGTGKKPSDLGYLKARKDIPEEIRRLILGEITDPGYLASKGFGQQSRDIALLDWLGEISENRDWVWQQSMVEWSPGGTSEKAERLQAQIAAAKEEVRDIKAEVQDLMYGNITNEGRTRINQLNRLVEAKKAEIAGWRRALRNAGTGPRKVTPFWLMAEAERLRAMSHYLDVDDAPASRALADRMEEAARSAMDSMDVDKIPDNFKQMPNSPRYGALRGLIVRKEIYNDVVGTLRITTGDESFAEQILGHGGFATKATQLWKWSKVAANPPAQIRNFVSNGVLLHLSGVPFHKVPLRVIQAIKQISAKSRGRPVSEWKHYDVARRYGVTESTFSAQELLRMERELLALEARNANKISMATLKAMAGRIMDVTGDWYQFAEALFKTAKIIDAMERQGKEEGDAAIEAQKWLFDYSLVGPSTRYLRNAPVGIPFLTFHLKALPRMIEVARTAPWRFLPYVALPYILVSMVANQADVDDDDVKALQKALPDWLQKRGHAYVLPVRDEQGRWQAMDFGYFLPWTMWTSLVSETAQGDVSGAMMTSGLLGGPLPDLIAALQTNRDPFTGRDIVNKSDPPARQLSSMLGYLYGMAAPTWLTEYGAVGHLLRAGGGDVDRYGLPRTDYGQAAGRLVGVNLYPIDPDTSRAENLRRMRFDISEINRRMKRQLQNRNLSDVDRQEVRDEYVELIRRRMEQMAKYASESRVHPNLRRVQ